MNAFTTDFAFYRTVNKLGALPLLIPQSITYLLYPLLGWLADVYFTRYKFALASFFTVIIGSILVIAGGLVYLNFPYSQGRYALPGISIIVSLIGVGLFESTAIQFGMDQMLEAPTSKLSSFAHWYYWSCNVGRLLIQYIAIGVFFYFGNCVVELPHLEHPIFHNLHPLEIQMSCTLVIILGGLQLVSGFTGLCLLRFSKKHLNIDRTGQHPLKLIYQVLKYAWKHKVPEKRSAFTYWEEDIPPRIDLGKEKYGGPFTTEEVEDAKTFFRILLLLFSLTGFHLSGHGYSLLDQLFQTQCPPLIVLLTLGDPVHVTIVTIILGVPVYQMIVARQACTQKYTPNMLKRMGLGLVCCLLEKITEITIQATMAGGTPCKAFEPVPLDFCYFMNIQVASNGTCTSIPSLTDNEYYCPTHSTPFLLLIIPSILQGLSFLLVFMTALEFICAQAPLRLKGLLIGMWYASLAVNFLFVEITDLFISKSNTWEVIHEIKAFLIFLSLMMYLCVSRRYQYRQRDEIVNIQYMIEDVYEREIEKAAQYEEEQHQWWEELLEQQPLLKNSACSNYGSN